MSKTANKTYSFSEFLKEVGNVRIPKIQRDYAQGRKNKDVDEIRKSFLHQLILVLKDESKTVELDFLYGSMRDGQQRLTALFLLHWILGFNNLQNSNKKSIFSYANRISSVDFCDELVCHSAKEYADTATQNGKALSDIIKNCDWFQWGWNYDATIQSMLVVLDTLNYDLEIGKSDKTEYDDMKSNLENIRFRFLNIHDLEMSDELFVKMNARGKQLSDFDKLKSTIEEDIQVQKEVPGTKVDDKLEEEWRTLMDGKWMDFFWKRRIKEKNKDNINNADAKEAEEDFRIFLIRMIGLQLFEKMPDEPKDEFYKGIYDNFGKKDLDNIIILYLDKEDISIDFHRLKDDINLLICDENNEVLDITSKLDKHSRETNQENCPTWLDIFLGNSISNDSILIFYSILEFLRASDCQRSMEWQSNFDQWAASTRNILSDNNNNNHLDKFYKVTKALSSIQEMVEDLKNFKKGPFNSEASLVNEFFAKNIKSYKHIDNSGQEEEKAKAGLRLLNNEWKEKIHLAESDQYLWGQIRCIVKWSNGDFKRFSFYSEELSNLLEFIKNNNLSKFHMALLSFKPFFWKEENKGRNVLYSFDFDRDYSLKRCLRDEASSTLIRDFLDEKNNKHKDCSIDEYCNKLIESQKDIIDPKLAWIRCLIKEGNQIFNWSYYPYKRIFENDGHIIISELKTQNSRCSDIILHYLSDKYKESKKYYNFSKDIPPNELCLNVNGDEIIIKWADNSEGQYIISKAGLSREVNAYKMLKELESENSLSSVNL